MSEADKPTTLSDVRSDRGDSAPAPSTLPEVRQDTYRLGREVARGGMGRVIEAHDLRVGRQVALKELLVESSQNAARFEREARVTARLQHPAIVPIYEIGRWPDGAPFYAMRMVEGRTLRTCLAEVKTLADRLALLPSIISAAEAIAYAHSHGVIHRDLTPANIMVGNFGETVVIDWGLAKVLGADDEPDAGPYRQQSDGLTLVGSVMGTPAYMPPEQAAGEPVDERGDVYSLGAILYHLLVGHAPFRGESPDAILTKVRTVVPEPIRVPEVPADLTSIVDKAMSRDPKHRYANASALVAELVRFRSGQLVGAHSYSRADLVRRWVREHRLAVFASAAAFAALVVMGTIAIVGIIRERDRADAERAVAIEQRGRANDINLALFEEQGRQELQHGDIGRALAYLNEAYKNGRDTPALRFLLAEALRSSDARMVGCGGPISHFAISPDEQHAALACGHVRVIDLATGRTLAQTPNNEIERVTYSRDGLFLVTVGAGPAVYDAATGARRAVLPSHDKKVVFAGFSADGSRAVTVGWDGKARIAHATDGALLHAIDVGEPPLEGVMGMMREDILLVASLHGTAEVFDVMRGARLGKFSHGARISNRSIGDKIVATCGDDGVTKLWSYEGALLRTFPARSNGVVTCLFSPDGRRLFQAGVDDDGDLFDLVRNATIATLTDTAFTATFDPSGQSLAILAHKQVTVHDTRSGAPVQRWPSVDFFGGLELTTKWIVMTELGALRIAPRSGPLRAIATPGERSIGVSADGTRLATRRDDGHVTLWDVERGVALAHPPLRQATRQRTDDRSFDEPSGVAFGGSRAAVITENGLVILDAVTGAVTHRFEDQNSQAFVSFDESGGRLLVSSPRPAVYELASKRDLLANHPVLKAFEISPDGKQALLRVNEHSLEVFNLDEGRRRGPAINNTGETGAAGFSRDGARVIFTEDPGGNGAARTVIWEIDGGVRLAAFPSSNALFSPTRELLASVIAGRLELRRVSDGSLVSAVHRMVGTDAPIAGAPNDEGTFAIAERFSDGRHSVELIDLQSGAVLATYGRMANPMKTLWKRGTEGVMQQPRWSGNAIVEASGGVSVWPISLEHRSPAAIDTLVRKLTPWRIVAGRLEAERAMVRGRVTRGKDAVASNARVTLTSSRWQMPHEAMTDAVGWFEIVVPDDTYDVSASISGQASPTQRVVASFREPIEMTLVIPE
jgi:WD40 repeat protein